MGKTVLETVADLGDVKSPIRQNPRKPFKTRQKQICQKWL
jgi:hypothetical protein